ncbi:hypothetical protein A7Q10_08320 [Methylacidiphilum caldifontis]|uniref:Uncharacterized protein n=2 Tax=Methylacidiphilum caldifontis TaxID=2795386 RepID=A0A4Y8PCX8_9BACT|nr:hypothetical protein A7Q10_08320 [Methylacidiphilum caldifontis]
MKVVFPLISLIILVVFPFKTWGKDQTVTGSVQSGPAKSKNSFKDQKVSELKKKHNRIVKIFEDWQQAVAKQNQKTASALHQEYIKEQQDFQKNWDKWEKEFQDRLRKVEKSIGNEAGKIQKEMDQAAQH